MIAASWRQTGGVSQIKSARLLRGRRGILAFFGWRRGWLALGGRGRGRCCCGLGFGEDWRGMGGGRRAGELVAIFQAGKCAVQLVNAGQMRSGSIPKCVDGGCVILFILLSCRRRAGTAAGRAIVAAANQVATWA